LLMQQAVGLNHIVDVDHPMHARPR
jgi:hypothetical protein